MAEFKARFEQLWPFRFSPLDKEAARIANQRRLSPDQQVRLRALLEKNREEGLIKDEETELDGYIAKIDRSLETTADGLLKLAEQRQQYTS